MNDQISIFDCLYPAYKIDTPIRLIELFAGVGSQAMALRDIGANFEHYRVVEFDKFAIASYNAIHGTDFKTTDIRDVHAVDLGICDKQRFTYLLTYSFPCQDLSKAGKQKGMSKGSGTRSGLLWEVERILLELKEKGELPQVLLMENVPDVIGNKNYADFMEWYSALEEMGYQSYYKILNAKNYGIPQNRERCFMVSILGKYSYQFPKGIELKSRLKDVLEDHVDEKYYLSQKIIETFTRRNEKENGFHFDTNERDIAKTVTAGVYKTRMDDNYVKVCGDVDLGNNDMNNRVYSQEGISPTINAMQGGNSQPKITIKEATKQGYAETEPGDSVNLKQPHSKTHRGRVGKGIVQTLTTSCNQGVVENNRFFKQALKTFSENDCVYGDSINSYNETVDKTGVCPTVTTRPEGFKTAIIAVDKNIRIRKLTPLECWRLMGFTDEDFKKAQQVNSNSQLYKQAGNSIVKQVLMAIFRQMI